MNKKFAVIPVVLKVFVSSRQTNNCPAESQSIHHFPKQLTESYQKNDSQGHRNESGFGE